LRGPSGCVDACAGGVTLLIALISECGDEFTDGAGAIDAITSVPA